MYLANCSAVDSKHFLCREKIDPDWSRMAINIDYSYKLSTGSGRGESSVTWSDMGCFWQSKIDTVKGCSSA